MGVAGRLRNRLRKPSATPGTRAAADAQRPVRRPLEPVPSETTFPPVFYLFAQSALPRNFAGRSRSIFDKMRMLSQRAGIESTMVLFRHSSELADIEHDLRQRGVLDERMHLVCLHDYYPDETSYTGPAISHEVDLPELASIKEPDQPVYRYFDAEGTYRLYRRFDHAGRLIVQDSFTPNRTRTLREEFRTDGTLRRRVYMDLHHNLPRQEIHYRRDLTPAFTIWWVVDPESLELDVERVTVFDAQGRPAEVHDSLEPINHLCLDRLIADRPTILSDEDRRIDRYVLGYRRNHVKRVCVLHNAHISEPYDDVQRVRTSFRPVFAARNELDAVVFLTATQRGDAEAKYGRTDTFRVLPHSTPPAVLTPGVERDPNLVVMMARLDTQKQVDHAIEAFAAVHAALPKARLEIYGSGPDAGSLRQLIADLGLRKVVTLMGFTTEPGAVYQRASLCLMTSRFEGAPLTLLEAMEYGCPVISYDLRYGPADIITDGVDGFLVRYGDRKAIADRITAVLPDRALMATVSQAATQRATDFNTDAHAARWAGLFTELAAALPAAEPTQA